MSATVSAPFDAYHKWLGIPPADQPPTHYRLLGLEACESDVEVIAGAADARLAQLRTYQSGRHARASQRLLNEVSAARACLLDHARKADYDRQIKWPRRGEKRISASPPAQPPPAAAPPVVRERSPAEMPPLVVAVQCKSPSQQFSRRRRSRLSPAGWFLVGFATFSAMLFGMAISAIVYWCSFVYRSGRAWPPPGTALPPLWRNPPPRIIFLSAATLLHRAVGPVPAWKHSR